MKRRIFIGTLAMAVIFSVSAKNDDPTLMTINGKKVPLSEFQYLYNKNNGQQLKPMTLEEYADMFVIYKLKVAEAEAAGIDTTAAFIKEFNGYRNELAEPYLRDSAEEERLIQESYSHMQRDIDVSHIMISKGNTPEINDKQKATLDSIRTAIINGADFAEAARKHSIDRAAKANGGHLGFMRANRLPYSFEKAAYQTAIGQISPVTETEFGYHIIRVEGERPAKGKVLAQHILKLTRGMSAEQETSVKSQIDSIYQLINDGADFSEIAKKESEDRGSAGKGGMLPWFGTAEMVPEFEEVAFSLENGAISKPFKTSYGYHIVKRLDSKETPTLDEARDEIKAAIARDYRSTLPKEAKVKELRITYNAKINEKNVNAIKAEISANNGIDSTFVAKYKNSNLELAKVGKRTVTIDDFFSYLPATITMPKEQATALLDNTINERINSIVLEIEKDNLENKQPEFRNLVNEYRDGMLLFEISNRNVWEKASNDREGLQQYFQKNKDKYTWDAPRYKGYIIHTTNDSIKSEISKYLSDNSIENDSLSKNLRKEFGKNVKIEKVIAAKGDNAIVDNLFFNGPAPAKKGRWVAYLPYNGKIISTPEEVNDVRGQVTGDYQNELEKAWVETLKAKYPVKVNKKLLKKVK